MNSVGIGGGCSAATLAWTGAQVLLNLALIAMSDEQRLASWSGALPSAKLLHPSSADLRV